MDQLFPEAPFPRRPFFSCEDDRFVIADQSHMSRLLRGEADPWLRLEVGFQNVLESRPVRVLRHAGHEVELECQEATVRLDFDSESARKVLPDGTEYVYRAGLDEANDGYGWMPVS